MNVTKIDCDECYQNIYLFIDQELSDQQYKNYESHFLECETCQNVLNDAQSFEVELRNLNLESKIPPENGWEKFQMKINGNDSLDLDIALPSYSVMDNILNNIKRNYINYGLLVTASFAFFMVQNDSKKESKTEQEIIMIAKLKVDPVENVSMLIEQVQVKKETFTPSYTETLEVEALATIDKKVNFQEKEIELPSFEKLQIKDEDLFKMISLGENSKVLMDKFPVSNKEYWSFIQKTKHNTPFNWEKGTYKHFDKTGLKPVTYVSWKDADAFCKWEGKSLPSEQEWMNAASSSKAPYPWGQTFTKAHANTSESGLGLIEIGSYPQNISHIGVSDLIGNVRQWVSDDLKDAKGGIKGLVSRLKIMKGGSFTDKAENSTIQKRFIGDKEVTFGNAGIRCVKREI
ncbi:MAG: hypothetical protein COB02_04420 [Candidatus Cloacimonadota bacterium]|nr:MAG: hypothetical protein COB02_04420 [Candidatus Cloacimonadota bacterium]